MIKVIDSIMGSGKTNWAIAHMNAETDRRFIYITPYINEVNRIIESCPGRNFIQPEEMPTKGAHFLELLREGENIAATHKLFQDFTMTDNIQARIQEMNYTLILDEVLDVVEPVKLSENDRRMLFNEEYIAADEETGLVEWQRDYSGKFDTLKRMIDHGNIYSFDNILLWRLPEDLLPAFPDAYVLTFMFEGSPMEQYLKILGLDISYYYISSGQITEGIQDLEADKARIADLITLCEDEKLNELGMIRKSLIRSEDDIHNSPYSKGWWDAARKKKISGAHQKDTTLARKALCHAYNFLYNKCRTTADDAMWSVFLDENAKRQKKKHLLEARYPNAFCPCNSRATNDYQDRHHLAYLINIYCNPVVQRWFREHDGEINEERFALSQLLQWLWRSRLRRWEPVDLYLPSERMRNLLTDWLRKTNA